MSLTTSEQSAGAVTASHAVDHESVIEQARIEMASLLARLRVGRASVENNGLREVKHMQDKLRQVSSTTEDAAMNIMDACDRALALVDELDALDADEASDRTATVAKRNTLRDELYLMMGALQFQDITSQQLAYAAGLLDDAEKSMVEMSRLFDPSQALEPLAVRGIIDTKTLAYDGNATTQHADARQAVADEIFTVDTAPRN